MEYTIAAIPTTYRGRRYRSRLEARWAAFFDLLEWRHEYEPFDLGGWSPDFLLPDFGALVEIKPAQEFPRDVFRKMHNTCAANGMFEGEDPAVRGLMLFGVAPDRRARSGCQLGWWTQYGGIQPSRAFLGWLSGNVVPRFKADVIDLQPDGWIAAGGDASSWGRDRGPKPYAAHTMELWAQATNMVQWKAPT
jgi:hypothetical protein